VPANVRGMASSAAKPDAPELPAGGGRVSVLNRVQSGPCPVAMGSLLDSIDRRVEKEAAKQLVPFTGW